MPEKLPAWEGSDVGVMGEGGWERYKYSWPVGKHWERQAGGKQMSVFRTRCLDILEAREPFSSLTSRKD